MVFITPPTDSVVTAPVPETGVTVIVHPNGGAPLVDVTIQIASIPYESVVALLVKLTDAVTSQLTYL